MHDVCGQLDEFAIIILGDAGFNYYLNKTDKKTKNRIEQLWGLTVYCVRGNHEQRPSLLKDIHTIYDEDTQGLVYIEYEWPHIKYFQDGNEYWLGQYRTLIIGGAYSVDKNYRLANHWQWFEQEQLSQEEMDKISLYAGQHFDLVLSHTCPLSWEPTDLFLKQIDQSSVDNSMEIWMEGFKDKISWTAWAFGHFHVDRILLRFNNRVRIFYEDIEELKHFVERAKN